MYIDIGYILFLLGFVGILILYMTVKVFFSFKASKNTDIYKVMRAGMLPLAIIGIYFFIISLYGQIFQPLPGSLNTLIFNPLISLSLVLMGFAWTIRTGQKMEYVGLFALLLGLLAIYYGITGYNIGITESASQFFIIYLAFGAVGILSFPVSLIIDLKPGRVANHSRIWSVFLALFCMILLMAILMAFLGAVFNDA